MVKIEVIISVCVCVCVCVCACACVLSVASEFSSSNWFIPSSKSLLIGLFPWCPGGMDGVVVTFKRV